MRHDFKVSPLAVRLAVLAGLLFSLSLVGPGEAVAGPTVKKRTWHTL